MNRLWALVPLKNLDSAKTRLAHALADSCRRALVMAMAHDVVAALVQARSVERVVLVSDIPDLPDLLGVPGVTSHCGAQVSGLNEDLSAAALWAGTQGASHVLIAHADLPLITPALVDRFVGTACGNDLPGGLRAAPCKHGTGTNLLLAPLPLPLPLVYGAGSLARFQALAAAAGISCAIRRDPMLAVDIDEPADYAALQLFCARGILKNSATATLLRSNPEPGLRTNIQADLRSRSSFQGRLSLFST
jgi:2-phospho-L-lactate guanylyltransferase